MTIHCPFDTFDLITGGNNYVKRDQISNFALYYRYFLDESDNKFGLQAQKSEDALEFVQDFADPQGVFTGQNSILENLRNRQTDQLRHLASSGEWLAPGHFLCATARLNWRLVVGIGSEHVQETNMTLDHVYGIPYLPGSALKGVLRSWVIQECFGNDEKLALRDIENSDPADLKEKKQDFFTVFGSQQVAGKVRFLDALPAGNFRFELDIMNPHFSKYYRGLEFPTDDQQLNPISFLTLKGVPFRFLIYAKTAAPLDIAKNWFTEAIANLGFGAKSAVGYGSFRELNDKTEELKYEFAEKLSLDEAYNIYHNFHDRQEFVHINIEELVSYAPKIAILVTEGICETESIRGIDDIPQRLIEADTDVVIPSEFGKWVWKRTKDKLFEDKLLEFPGLTTRFAFRNAFSNLSPDQRKLLQEKLLEVSVNFRRVLSNFSEDERRALGDRLIETVESLENGSVFTNLPPDKRKALAEKMVEIWENFENCAACWENEAAIPESINVEGGRSIQCGVRENGNLVLKNYTNP